MESIPRGRILQIRPDTLEQVRKEYNLEKKGRMEEAVKMLDEWIQKQPHFKKKDFDPYFLETTILASKGSLERAKRQIDKNCTLRTLLPVYFGNFNVRNDFKNIHDVVQTAVLPKLTPDHYRIVLTKFNNIPFDSSDVINFYRYNVILGDYLKSHDYLRGFIVISDYSDANMMDYVSKINPIDLRNAFSIYLEGYGMRIKGIHIVCSSKFVDAFITILKQVLSEKVANRISVHKSIDDLSKVIPKEILPVDYGGDEKSIKTLSDEWIDVLSTKEHMDYVADMNQAGTDESLRQPDKFCDTCAGMPGSFRILSVD
ncbi:alpha-tocopherol transfer protein-like isoform X2 [Danaus plexippus]|uniref:CRAL/TRIO domain-containing protein n=2 Tax=Danaus plexippus TaxID=13037 RepID=A0A212FN73_DANPL|nr:alpha-tocopherol transfer protein-like isoform X2 [Danaus plexippus]OWR55140.1 putative CRAL/TRIO domain-containing protein [Danaus plexippus plexippus]